MRWTTLTSKPRGRASGPRHHRLVLPLHPAPRYSLLLALLHALAILALLASSVPLRGIGYLVLLVLVSAIWHIRDAMLSSHADAVLQLEVVYPRASLVHANGARSDALSVVGIERGLFGYRVTLAAQAHGIDTRGQRRHVHIAWERVDGRSARWLGRWRHQLRRARHA